MKTKNLFDKYVLVLLKWKEINQGSILTEDVF